MNCPSPHPLRAPPGLDLHADLEVIGTYGTDSWARCRKCSKWFWLTSDLSSKWQYFDEWEVDAALAERACVEHDAGAAAELLVSNDLPWGPPWTSSSALVDMLRALTPSATDGERKAAVDAAIAKGQPPPRAGTADNRWLGAAKLLGEIATHEAPHATDLPFALDVTLQGCVFGEYHEIGSSLVLFQTAPSPGLVRLSNTVSVLPAAGAARFLARNDDALLFEASGGICSVDGAGVLIAFPPHLVGSKVTSLEDGWWLFTPSAVTNVRDIELHAPGGSGVVAKARMVFEPGAAYPCPPRRMGDGWVLSGCLDAEGTEHALTLVDASFKAIAQSGDARGQRLVAPSSAESLWSETVKSPYVLERWERRGDVLERTFELESQAWCAVKGGVVVSPRKVGSGIVGYDDAGTKRFHIERRPNGATYFAEVPGGLLVYGASAELIDPATGETLATFDAEDTRVFVGHDGTGYLRERVWLWVIGRERQRVFVGEGMQLETTCGDAALLRDDRGECLVIGSDAVVRGRFSAPSASFSVVGTRGGPYVVEGGRVRVARFPG